jgi:hypothetical protein
VQDKSGAGGGNAGIDHYMYNVGFFIGDCVRTTPLLEPQEAYTRAPLECSGLDTT